MVQCLSSPIVYFFILLSDQKIKEFIIVASQEDHVVGTVLWPLQVCTQLSTDIGIVYYSVLDKAVWLDMKGKCKYQLQRMSLCSYITVSYVMYLNKQSKHSQIAINSFSKHSTTGSSELV